MDESDPIERFLAERTRASERETVDMTAAVLATVAGDGRPSARYVLVKHVDADGFRFFTNYASRKARELARSPHAALVWHWPVSYIQVRVEGAVERLPEAESDAYFAARPRAHQLGAWASPQSEVVEGARVLAERFAAEEARWNGMPVARPPHWGGYCVVPDRIEFWYGQEARMHDRIAYEAHDGGWRSYRLAP